MSDQPPPAEADPALEEEYDSEEEKQAEQQAATEKELGIVRITSGEAEEALSDDRFSSATKPGDAFPTIILSHLGPVRSQVDSGSKWLKRHMRMVEEVEKTESQFHKAMQKAVEHEKAKVREETDEAKEKVKRDKMKRTWNAQMAMYGSFDKVAQVHSEQSKLLDMEIVKPLTEAVKDNQNRVKTVYKEAEIALKTLNAALQKVKKSKEKAEQAIKTRDAAIVREKKESESGKKGKSLMSRISEISGTNSAQSEAKVKAAKQAYEESITSYNQLKKQWEEEQLVKIMKDLELLERDRIEIQRLMCVKLQECYNKQSIRMKMIADEFGNAVTAMDTEQDIRNFSLDIERNYGPVHFSDPLQDEIGEWEPADNLGENSRESVFNQSLAEIMKQQRGSHPDLKVPSTMILLIDAIKSFDGFKREGIFRISASVDKVNAAKKQIIAGEVPQFDDPFVPADLFKVFLRELPDSLFGACYDQCIEIAKNEDASLEDYRKFYTDQLQIPVECRAVLDFIWELMLEYTKPEFSDGSKMTLRNYAIVFAPSLMRPSKEEEADWMNHIQNAPYETLFVLKLAQAIGKHDINPPAIQEKIVRPSASAMKALEDMQTQAMKAKDNPNSPLNKSGMFGRMTLRPPVDTSPPPMKPITESPEVKSDAPVSPKNGTQLSPPNLAPNIPIVPLFKPGEDPRNVLRKSQEATAPVVSSIQFGDENKGDAE